MPPAAWGGGRGSLRAPEAPEGRARGAGALAAGAPLGRCACALRCPNGSARGSARPAAFASRHAEPGGAQRRGRAADRDAPVQVALARRRAPAAPAPRGVRPRRGPRALARARPRAHRRLQRARGERRQPHAAVRARPGAAAEGGRRRRAADARGVRRVHARLRAVRPRVRRRRGRHGRRRPQPPRPSRRRSGGVAAALLLRAPRRTAAELARRQPARPAELAERGPAARHHARRHVARRASGASHRGPHAPHRGVGSGGARDRPARPLRAGAGRAPRLPARRRAGRTQPGAVADAGLPVPLAPPLPASGHVSPGAVAHVHLRSKRGARPTRPRARLDGDRPVALWAAARSAQRARLARRVLPRLRERPAPRRGPERAPGPTVLRGPQPAVLQPARGNAHRDQRADAAAGRSGPRDADRRRRLHGDLLLRGVHAPVRRSPPVRGLAGKGAGAAQARAKPRAAEFR